MFTQWLKHPAHTDMLSGQPQWSAPVPGIQVCVFRCRATCPLSFPAHTGQPLELLFCTAGGLNLDWSPGRRISLRPQQVLLLTDLSSSCTFQWLFPPFQGILVTAAGDGIQERLSRFYTLLGTPQPSPHQLQTLIQHCCGCAVVRETPWVTAAFSGMAQVPPQELSRYCVLKAAELLYLLCCGSPLLPAQASSRYYDHHQTETVRQVHDYMLSHLNENLTIAYLSQKFHISSTMLKSCFRSQYGKPIHAYLLQARMLRAAKLLVSSTLSVSQIAAAVGYDSASQFSASFRRIYQCSPSQYRKAAAQ